MHEVGEVNSRRERSSMPMRTQVERRGQTTSAILEASLQALIEDGYSGFSVSGVAARAGISRGSLEHYYPRKIDLVQAATEFAMEQAIAQARAMVPSPEIPNDPLQRFLASSEQFFFSPMFLAMTELAIAARSDVELAKVVHPIIVRARQTLDAIWTDTLVLAGHPRAHVIQFIELSHYLLRGVFYVSILLPYDIDRRSVVETWRKLAPAALHIGGPQEAT